MNLKKKKPPSETEFVGSFFEKRGSIIYEKISRACKRAQWVRAPAAKSQDPSLIPRTTEWKERQPLQDVLPPLHLSLSNTQTSI